MSNSSVQGVSPLLIAINPSLPLAKAIRSTVGAYHCVTAGTDVVEFVDDVVVFEDEVSETDV